ncbi:MAG TPA: hypothetical protein VHJ78_04815, partial [Actinomycetota bacterium]|nr:hypothetical protein [Actinomycetota bacterium]
KTYHGYRLQRLSGRWVLVPPDRQDQPVQPELGNAGAGRVVIVRKNRMREVPGTAPPKKKKCSSGRPAPWERDPFDERYVAKELPREEQLTRGASGS